jgi:hypothetical protein
MGASLIVGTVTEGSGKLTAAFSHIRIKDSEYPIGHLQSLLSDLSGAHVRH